MYSGRLIINTRLLTILIAIYGGMLVYASLMPFDFAWDGRLTGEFASIWKIWPIYPEARSSGSDIISNLALYFPLAWGIALRLRISGSGIIFSIFISSIVCSVLSAGIEAFQLLLISRISSASDWIVNSLSGCAGAVFGALWGRAIWSSIHEWLQTAWWERPIDIATTVFAGLLAADALSPFLPTILLKQVLRNMQNSQLNPWDAFSLHAWHWWLVTRVAVYTLLTILLAAWGGRKRPAVIVRIKAAVLAVGFAVFLEVGKLMIVSRTFNSANVAASLLGCCIAVIIGRYLAGKISARLKVELASAAIVFYILYLAWTPFDFVWISDIFKRINFSPIQLLPFYHYAMGSEINHVRLFVQSVFLIGIFVYLLRLRIAWLDRNRFGFLVAVILCALLGAIAEGGQIFILSRWPSMTDVYCFAIGGGFGAWIKRPSSHQVVSS